MKRAIALLLAALLLSLIPAACAKNADLNREEPPSVDSPSADSPSTANSADDSIPFAPAFLFTTTDLEGNPCTEQIFAGQKLTILNFWEPWCGPCVHEMPYLEKLSQEYAGEVLILGIYQTPNAEEDVRKVLEDSGVTYPIVHYTPEFDFLQTGYVPTTVVVSQSGAIVVEPFAGSLRYDGWVQLVEGAL